MRRLPERLARALPVFGGAAVALLGAFHIWLLWRRVAERALLEPEVGARWLGALLLLLAVAGMRRHGLSPVLGRRAPVFWALVVVLHVQAAEPAPGEGRRAILVVLPATVGTLVLAGLVARDLRAAAVRRLRPIGAAPPTRAECPRPDAFRPLGAPRGPPLVCC